MGIDRVAEEMREERQRNRIRNWIYWNVVAPTVVILSVIVVCGLAVLVGYAVMEVM